MTMNDAHEVALNTMKADPSDCDFTAEQDTDGTYRVEWCYQHGKPFLDFTGMGFTQASDIAVALSTLAFFYSLGGV